MLTKKDFKLAAATLKHELPSDPNQREEMIRQFCRVFQTLNPRFDERIFRAWLIPTEECKF